MALTVLGLPQPQGQSIPYNLFSGRTVKSVHGGGKTLLQMMRDTG